MITVDGVRANIRAVRKAKRLSAMVVSERMHISRPFYTQLEGGSRRLNVDYLIRATKALDVEPESFFKE